MKTKTFLRSCRFCVGRIFLFLLVSALPVFLSCQSPEVQGIQRFFSPLDFPEAARFLTRDVNYLRILFAGDTHFAWRIEKLQKKYGTNFPVHPLARLFGRADYRILNLETVLANQGKPFLNKSYVFSAKPKAIGLLKFLSVDSVVLGNNHSMDLGQEGLIETISHLRLHGISSTGAGRNTAEAESPLLVKIDGIRIALFSYSLIGERRIFASRRQAGVRRVLAKIFQRQMQTFRSQADFVMVSLHWGTEYYTRPNIPQIRLAHSLIDLGADAIVGHHPHVPFGVEVYRHGFIAYSLGNFLFGSVNERQDNNFVLRLDIDRRTRRLHSVRIFPVFGKYRENTKQAVRPLTPLEARIFWRQMYLQTQALSSATAEKIEVNRVGEGRILLGKKEDL